MIDRPRSPRRARGIALALALCDRRARPIAPAAAGAAGDGQGHWGLDAVDGGFSNNRHGPRRHKWSAPEPGVIQTGDHYRQTVVLPDGGFVSFVFKYRARKKPGGPMVEHWGKVCG